MPKKIVIVRHGETDFNKKDILQGQLPIGLNNSGLKQAKRVAQQLKHDLFDTFFSSDLKRTVQTAQEIQKIIKKEFSAISHLRERGLGKLEGKHKDAAFAALELERGTVFPLHHFWDFDEKPSHAKYEIETKKHMYHRLADFVKMLKNKYADKSVLIVSHGGTIRALLYTLGITDISFLKKMPIKNTAILRLHKKKNRYDISIEDKHVGE